MIGYNIYNPISNLYNIKKGDLYMSITTLFLRYMCAKNDYKRDKGLSISDELVCYKNIKYGT